MGKLAKKGKPPGQTITRADTPALEADLVVPPAKPTGARTSIASLSMSLRSGPLPDADELERYQNVNPKFADAIVDSFVEQGKHRRSIEKSRQEVDAYKTRATVWNERLSMGCAAFFVSAVLGVSGYLAMHDHEATAMVLGGLDIASVAGVFVYKHAKRRDSASKKHDRDAVDNDSDD